ncbi:MAG: DUF5615 family PIN-like protein [Ignavibacteria bacterium]|jgi:predicted nuclease of predicted toxin-antitoxin system|nr:DUF5615 family PIN-like protein [Ignavibacteria bacterium]
MNLLIDESVDKQISDLLKIEGHNVIYIAESSPGISDDLVFEKAIKHNAILITADKDFGELVFRLKKISTGILLIRLSGVPSSEKARIISDILKQYSKDLHNSFSVIDSNSIRIRRVINS